MSATMDADHFSNYFKADVLYLEGRSYPVEVSVWCMSLAEVSMWCMSPAEASVWCGTFAEVSVWCKSLAEVSVLLR